MTAASTTKTRAPRAPQDRQTKSDALQSEEAPPIGHDFLLPIEKMRSGTLAAAQADIADIFKAIGVDLTDENRDATVEIETTPEVLRQFGKLGAYLEDYVVPDRLDDYIALDSGPGSQSRISDLAMWFLGEMGKSERSAT